MTIYVDKFHIGEKMFDELMINFNNWIIFGLVSLFNGISTFLGCLMSKSSLETHNRRTIYIYIYIYMYIENHSNCKHKWVQVSLISSLTCPCAPYMVSDESNKLETYTYVRTKWINPWKIQILSWTNSFIYIYIYIWVCVCMCVCVCVYNGTWCLLSWHSAL